MLDVTMNPDLAGLLASLAEISVRSSAAAISTRVSAARKGKQQDEALNELAGIINELVAEREKLVGIAQGLEAALVAQRISDDDITYIVDKVIPAVKSLVPMGTGPESAEGQQFVAMLETLLSVETLTVLQLVGFNYKSAVGEPLTELVRSLILAQIPVRGS